MKKLKYILIIFIFSTVTGCSSEDYTITFNENNVLSIGSNSSCELIEIIGDTEIKPDMIKDNSITIDNFEVKCSDIDLSTSGEHTVEYRTNQVEDNFFERKIVVKDITVPTITFLGDAKKGTLNLEVGDIDAEFDLDKYFEISDNYDKNVKYSISGEFKNSAGTYELEFLAIDSSKNSTKKTLTIVMKDKEIAKEEEKEPSKEDGSSGNTEDTPPVVNKPTTTKPSTSTTNKPSTITPNESSNTGKLIVKQFNFSDNGDAMDTFNACVIEMYSLNGGSCIPISDGDGVYTGYELRGYTK